MKPPKKCLAVDDADDGDTGGDMKAENMKFAEQIRASFAAADSEKGSSGNGRGGRGKKRKQAEVADPTPPPAAVKKTPKIVIKFAKGNSSNSNTPPPPPNSASAKEGSNAKEATKNNGGISEYDFADDGINVDGNMDVANTAEGGGNKGAKIKFKMPQKD